MFRDVTWRSINNSVSSGHFKKCPNKAVTALYRVGQKMMKRCLEYREHLEYKKSLKYSVYILDGMKYVLTLKHKVIAHLITVLVY